MQRNGGAIPDPQYQDEYILGFQKAITDNFSGGVRAIYRDLKRSIDDQCDYRVFEQWADDNGYAIDSYNPAFAYCHIYNPGRDLDVDIDIDADGTLEHVVIPANQLGPKSKRTYTAVEFFAEGQITDKFFLQGSYTWSRNKGNAEGGVKSDIGQDDTGVTQDFDYPELMVGADGYLPNDRRHTLKLFGNYEFNEQWSTGANFLYQSGRPINCFGVYGDDPVGYLNSYFSCDARSGRSGYGQQRHHDRPPWFGWPHRRHLQPRSERCLSSVARRRPPGLQDGRVQRVRPFVGHPVRRRGAGHPCPAAAQSPTRRTTLRYFIARSSSECRHPREGGDPATLFLPVTTLGHSVITVGN